MKKVAFYQTSAFFFALQLYSTLLPEDPFLSDYDKWSD